MDRHTTGQLKLSLYELTVKYHISKTALCYSAREIKDYLETIKVELSFLCSWMMGSFVLLTNPMGLEFQVGYTTHTQMGKANRGMGTVTESLRAIHTNDLTSDGLLTSKLSKLLGV